MTAIRRLLCASIFSLGLLGTVAPQGLPSSVTSVTPSSVAFGSGALILITGTFFIPGDEVWASRTCPGGGDRFLLPTITQFGTTQLLASTIWILTPDSYQIQVWRDGMTTFIGAAPLEVLHPAPIVAAHSPISFAVGDPAPPQMTLQGSALGGYSDCDSIHGSEVRWSGPTGFYVWPLPQPQTSISLPVPPELLLEPGLATITVWNRGPGGGTVAFQIPITCAALQLRADHPTGPGSLGIRNLCGDPGAFYATAISFDPLNITMPGGGFWFGLHISLFDFAAQMATGAPPFYGQLSFSGTSEFLLPAGALPPGLPTAWLVSTTFGPGTFQILETSSIVRLENP
jgi:hypothetical protein